MEDNDLTCFEHSMSLPYSSACNKAVGSHDPEFIPHDPIIPDDFLAPEVPDDDDDDDNHSTPGSSSNNHLLGLASRNKYQRQIVESYSKLEPQLVVPCTRDEHVSLLNSRKLSKSLPDLTSSVTMMTLIPTNLFHRDSAVDSAFNSITSPVKFVEHPVDDALPTAVPKPTNSDGSGNNEVTSKDCPESLSIPSLNNTNHLSKSDTSAFRTPLKSTTPNFEFGEAEIKEESSVAVANNGGCNNNSADSSGNNSVLNCESHSSSLEAAVTSVGVQNASRHNILVSPLTPPFTPAYYSSYFISNCPNASRATTSQQSKSSYTVYNISPIHINSPWPFVNNSNPMLCSVVSSPRPQPTTSQQQSIINDGFSHPQQPILSSTLSRNPPTSSRAGRISPIGSSVRKNLFISTNMDIRRPQPIAPKATLGNIMGKKEQVEMLRTYPPRISRKTVCQNVNEGEEDGSWNEDSPTKRMHRSVPTLCSVLLVDHMTHLEHYMKCLKL